MKSRFTLLLLLGSLQSIAQTGLILSCPDADTVACIDAIPEADLSLLFVETDCNLDYNGNEINPPAATVCDTAYVGCYFVTPVSIVELDNGNTRYEIEVNYEKDAACDKQVSYAVFSLPEGVEALEYEKDDEYDGLLGEYEVEYVKNNPFYGIKFEADDKKFVPGTREVFTYTLPKGTAYEEVKIYLKAANKKDEVTLSLVCSSDPGTPNNSVVNYETSWIQDYIEPGGTGCIGDPIIVTRSFGARDACDNSASCTQEFYIESECFNDTPVGCGTDTTTSNFSRTALPSNNIWQPEQALYAVTFPSYEEHEGGYYSISEIWQPMGNNAVKRELGRMPPIWQEEYSFAHESIEPNDSILVEWIGNAIEVSGNTTAQIQAAGVYPNPGSDAFKVTFPEVLIGVANVSVFDQLGRLQFETSASGGKTFIELNGAPWTSGLYRIQVIDEAGSMYQTTWLKQ